MSEPSDRRRHARVAAHLHVEIEVEGGARVQAPLVHEPQVAGDLSEGGLFVSCERPLPLGARVRVRIRRDDEVLLSLRARVVRVRWGGRERGAPVDPGMALAFDPLAQAQQDEIARLLRGDPPSS